MRVRRTCVRHILERLLVARLGLLDDLINALANNRMMDKKRVEIGGAMMAEKENKWEWEKFLKPTTGE